MEWETLPHVIWTRDSNWDPAIFDHEFDEGGDVWYDALMEHAETHTESYLTILGTTANDKLSC